MKVNDMNLDVKLREKLIGLTMEEATSAIAPQKIRATIVDGKAMSRQTRASSLR